MCVFNARCKLFLVSMALDYSFQLGICLLLGVSLIYVSDRFDNRIKNASSLLFLSVSTSMNCTLLSLSESLSRFIQTITRIVDKIIIRSVTGSPYVDPAYLVIKTSE